MLIGIFLSVIDHVLENLEFIVVTIFGLLVYFPKDLQNVLALDTPLNLKLGLYVEYARLHAILSGRGY